LFPPPSIELGTLVGSTTEEIYLDNAATTKPWPQVREAVANALESGFGNASSLHKRGLDAAQQIAQAADHVKDLAGSREWRVVFTSGGSESITTAILGTVPRGKRDTVVTSTVEHAAVEDACKLVAERGGRVLELSAGSSGVVDPDDFAAAVDERTALVSLVHVASEMGTTQPVEQVGRLVKRAALRCRVHVDAVQAAAQLGVLDYSAAVDMVSISAHKIHGPQGVGALLLRPNVVPRQLICGGDQQEGIRPGTFNLPGIVGFGVAAALTVERRQKMVGQMASQAQELIQRVVGEVTGVRLMGDRQARAPGMVVLAVEGVRSQVLLHALEMRGVLASSGSACHSRRTRPPRCLLDAGLRSNEGVVRFSLGPDTSDTEIDAAARAMIDSVVAIREGRAGKT
jgi:cysteine desulfurase